MPADVARHVYDKAKYHAEAVELAGLDEGHASNHTVYMLRWLVENNLMSDFFLDEGSGPLARYRAGDLSIHDLLTLHSRHTIPCLP